MYCEIIDLQQGDSTSYGVRLKKLSEPKGWLQQMYPPLYIYEPIEGDCYTLHTIMPLYLGQHVYIHPFTEGTQQLVQLGMNQC